MRYPTPLKRRVAAACHDFLARAPVEDSTLTLDGTGVNGHVQFLVLKTLGIDVVKRLGRVNLISGSAYTYCAFLGIESGLVADARDRMQQWDENNRTLWHRASFASAMRRAYGVARGTEAFFANDCLEKMMRGTATDAIAEQRIGDLPSNAVFWLYAPAERKNIAVSALSPYSATTVAALARCCAAIPRLYSPAALDGLRVIDPVFSPGYKDLRQQLRAEARNHLISNVVVERNTSDTIWLKPHDFAAGKRMVLEDFARMVFNRPNPRIFAAYAQAYEEAAHAV